LTQIVGHMIVCVNFYLVVGETKYWSCLNGSQRQLWQVWGVSWGIRDNYPYLFKVQEIGEYLVITTFKEGQWSGMTIPS
jgi:hypothetical protein